MTKTFALMSLIGGGSLLLGIYWYTNTPELSPYSVILPLFVLLAAMLAIPAGFFLSFRGYLLRLLITAGLVLLIPWALRGPLDSLACSTYGRTPIDELQDMPNGAQVEFCGRLVSCELAALAADGSRQEVCVIRDTHSQAAIVYFNYTLNERAFTAQERAEQQAFSLRDAQPGSIVVRTGAYQPGLGAACGVPGVCAIQPLPFGELYSSPTIYDAVN